MIKNYVVVETQWEYNDEYYRPGGAKPIVAFTNKAKAAAYAAKKSAEFLREHDADFFGYDEVLTPEGRSMALAFLSGGKDKIRMWMYRRTKSDAKPQGPISISELRNIIYGIEENFEVSRAGLFGDGPRGVYKWVRADYAELGEEEIDFSKLTEAQAIELIPHLSVSQPFSVAEVEVK